LNANEDETLADLQMSATLMISIVFPSLIIHDFDKHFSNYARNLIGSLYLSFFFQGNSEVSEI